MSRSSAHEQFDRLEKPRTLSDRSFGFLAALVLAAYGCSPLFRGGPVHWWALGASGAVLSLALIWAPLLHPAAWLWMRVSLILSRVLTVISMGLLFFLVITPTGLVRRLFVRDPLRLRRDPDAASYWLVRRPPGPAPESMANQF